MAPTTKTPPPQFHYAVIGRHHGDDEDQCIFVAAQSDHLAHDAFKEAIDRKAPQKEGRDVYITASLCSETPIAETDTALQATAQIQDPQLAEMLIAAAQQHGEDSEPDHEVGDLQEVVRAMWKLLTPSQRVAVLRSDEVQNIAETTLGKDLPTDISKLDEAEVREALAAFGLDPSLPYPDKIKLDAVSHMRVIPPARHQYAHCDGWGHIFGGSTETTTRWAADTKSQALIDAQHLTPLGWKPLAPAESADLLESIKDNDAFTFGPGHDLGVDFCQDVSDLPEWVNAPTPETVREREGA